MINGGDATGFNFEMNASGRVNVFTQGKGSTFRIFNT